MNLSSTKWWNNESTILMDVMVDGKIEKRECLVQILRHMPTGYMIKHRTTRIAPILRDGERVIPSVGERIEIVTD